MDVERVSGAELNTSPIQVMFGSEHNVHILWETEVSTGHKGLQKVTLMARLESQGIGKIITGGIGEP